MDRETIEKHARRLIAQHNAEYEFSDVYEDEELEGLSEGEQEAIYEAMYDAWREDGW